MKKDSVAFWLVGALMLSTLATAGMCYSYLRTTRALRDLQPRLAQVNASRQTMQGLAAELNQYAAKNPAIVPLLEQMNVRLRAAAMTNAPGGRP